MFASDLAHKLECTEKQVIDIKHEFHLKTREVIVDRVVETDINDDDVKFIEITYRKRLDEKAVEAKLKREEKEKLFLSNLSKLKEEHPLVTDERCFRLSWWPDTVPNCFEDLEEK